MQSLPIFLVLICTFLTGVSRADIVPPRPAVQADTAAVNNAPTPPAPTDSAPTPTTVESTTAPAPIAGAKGFAPALDYFKKNDFAHSREAFNQVLAENPQDPVVLYNLGLVEFSDKHPGRALAYWRKALYLKPGFSPVLAGMSQLKKAKLLPADDEESALTWLYWRVPLTALLTLSLLLFAGTGFFWIRFAALRKQDKPAPFTALACCAMGLVVFLGLAVHDYQLFQFETKATVMEAAVPAYSSPSPDAPSLFEFHEGDQVTIRRTQDDWLQVQKSATAVGWVKKSQILIHSGT